MRWYRGLSLVMLPGLCALLYLTAHGAEMFGNASQRYVFFDQGKALCRLVVPDQAEPEEREAADLIRSTFEGIGGVKIPVLSESKTPSADVIDIHVGRTGVAMKHGALPDSLDADGFAIRPVEAKTLVLLGGRSVSTFYAATEFLERHAGVLWVWPGEDGMVIPKMTRLEITVRDQVSEPAFRVRRFSGMKSAKMKFYRIHQTARERRSEFHHNVWKVLKPEKYWDAHPEYFGEVEGRRVKPVRHNSNWQACTSNPDVVQVFIEAAKAQFDKYPWNISFSVSQNDGSSGFCSCSNCRALDVPGEEGISDRYFTFMNAVADGIAESHPDKSICCLAYGVATRNVPKRITLRPNTMVYAVVTSMQDVHEDIRRWATVAPTLGVYFWLHGKAVPKFYPHRFATYLNFLHENHVKEVYAEVYQDNEKRMASWELDGPRVWMTAKLLWNPDADIDELMTRFCSRFYGDAKEPMLRYYRRCEEAWERREDLFDFGRKWREFELDQYTAEDMDIMEACLDEALGLARTEPVKKRLEKLHAAFSQTALWVRQSDFGRQLASLKIGDRADAEQVVARVQQVEEESRDMVARGLSLFGGMPHACELIVDATFDKITRLLGDGAAPFWRSCLEKYPLTARFVEMQLKVLSGEIESVAVNPGFETPRKTVSQTDPALEWQGLNAAGWDKWIRPGTPGRVVVDETVARSGKRSLMIEGCECSCALQNRHTTPGQRYRITCWMRTSAEPNPAKPEEPPAGTLTIKWRTPDGKWHDQLPPVVDSLPKGTAEWTKLTCVFTVMPKVGRAVIMLGTKGQGAGDKVWFDDVRIELLHNPPAEAAKQP